ncbi:Hypothetical predicted protein, partial [Pelobates cultripes]
AGSPSCSPLEENCSLPQLRPSPGVSGADGRCPTIPLHSTRPRCTLEQSRPLCAGGGDLGPHPVALIETLQLRLGGLTAASKMAGAMCAEDKGTTGPLMGPPQLPPPDLAIRRGGKILSYPRSPYHQRGQQQHRGDGHTPRITHPHLEARSLLPSRAIRQGDRPTTLIPPSLKVIDPKYGKPMRTTPTSLLWRASAHRGKKRASPPHHSCNP